MQEELWQKDPWHLGGRSTQPCGCLRAGDTLWTASEEASAVLTRRQESTAAPHCRREGHAMAQVHPRLSTSPLPTGTLAG